METFPSESMESYDRENQLSTEYLNLLRFGAQSAGWMQHHVAGRTLRSPMTRRSNEGGRSVGMRRRRAFDMAQKQMLHFWK
jgi:hypothetical protein